MSITIRRATPQDKPRILEISSQIWDGDDYIPHVIDEWLADAAAGSAAAELAVAVVDGDVVAFARYMWLLPGVAWFEGIRTDPATQNRGAAKAITRYFLDKAVRAGAKRACLSTYVDNQASIHIIEAHGFARAASLVYLEAGDASPARSEARAAAHVVDISVAEATAFIRDSAFLAVSRGWFPVGWKFYPFDLGAGVALAPPRTQHLVGIREGDRLVALLCARDQDRAPGDLTINYVDGPAQHVETLIRHALYLALDRRVVDTMVPRWGDETGPALAVFQRLGFTAWYEFQADVFVYEQEIGAG
ncbi:MAG: GNAT family N-acetyltransferase [Chloroflexi bacterium]|nr:GNAT family N-acetyltransferase [Chloroflexota bacterium]MBU1751643.1 GNAT family N-acetyltransferase [Chloroflexota bacterium]